MHSHLEVNEFKHELNWTPIDVVLDVFEPACAHAADLPKWTLQHARMGKRPRARALTEQIGRHRSKRSDRLALAIIRTRLT